MDDFFQELAWRDFMTFAIDHELREAKEKTDARVKLLRNAIDVMRKELCGLLKSKRAEGNGQ